MMESIEKLREFIDDQFVSSGQAYLHGMAIAGSIERFDSMETAEISILSHPELLRCASLLRDYWYAKKAKEGGDD